MNNRSIIFAATIIPDPENGRVIIIPESRRVINMPTLGSVTPSGVTDHNDKQGDLGRSVADRTNFGGGASFSGHAVGGAAISGDTTIYTGVSNKISPPVVDGVTAEAAAGGAHLKQHRRPYQPIYVPLEEDELDFDFYQESDDDDNENDDNYDDDDDAPTANSINSMPSCPGG